jgi:hypothetical protein
MGIENAQNTPGNMLPVGLPSGPTSDRRTDAQIAAEKKGTSDLESGTVRDANGQIRNMRQFKVDPPESYVQYVKRVEGLVDIQILTEEAWRKATGQKTRTEEILAELGVTPAPKEVLTEPPAVTGPLTDAEVETLSNALGLNVLGVEELGDFGSLQTLTIEDGKEVVAQHGTITHLVPLQTPVLNPNEEVGTVTVERIE